MYDSPKISLPQRHRMDDGGTIAAGSAERRISLAFLSLFVLCLAVPMLQTIYPVAQLIFPGFEAMIPPLEERRQPNPSPAPALLFRTDGAFAAALNKWFDDRVGFRDLFIRAKNQVDYTLFRTSRKVYVGYGGWHFEHNGPPMSAQTLTALKTSIVALAEKLREKGVRLVVVGYPDKSEIYPEEAPPELPKRSEGGNFERLRQFLASRTDLIFIDAQKLLKRERTLTSEHLYAKTDLHPTPVGQLPVVKEIIARIAHAEGRPQIRWNENFTLAHGVMGPGSETRFLSLLTPAALEKDYPYFKGAYTIGGQEPDGHWVLTNPNVAVADEGIGRPFDWEFVSLPELCNQRLPGMVLFGNSFSDYYWPLGLHRYFCFIRRARDPMSRLKLFYETMPANTKYFIFQFYEPIAAPPTFN